MKIIMSIAFTAVTILVLSDPASAQPAPKPTISAELVARLCPLKGVPGLKLGATRDEQSPELLRSLRRLPESFRPFTEAELDDTAWSGRVAAITYRAASPDGDINDALLEDFDEIVVAAGWEPFVLDRTITPLSVLGGRSLRREVDGPDGKRTLLLEFDVSGALAMRCGDPGLLEQDQRERNGALEPGTQRPVAPPYDPTLRLPELTACQSIDLQRLIVEKDKLDEKAPELAPFLAAAMQESDQAHFGKRLSIWLEWKLFGSGKVDDNRLLALRTGAVQEDNDRELGQMMDFLAIGSKLAGARESGEALKSCEAMRELMVFTHDKSRKEAVYWQKINEALEAEVRRLGIALN